ncbi:MAG: hypothetical protein RLZZ305_960 [Actinomycetota bacterium]
MTLQERGAHAPWPTIPPVSNSHGDAPDLDRIERELADVETALARLEDGSYWTCEVTGAPIPDDVLAANPVARRSV